MSSSEDEDDFATFGTPLEPFDEDSVQKKKPFSVEDQVVKDKQGRRRFHGAFTGGFSAGFFNTVGSLEGWTPSTFKSSRAGKAEKKGQRPEDFMDEEDMEEHGIAPKVLRATTDFNDQTGKKRDRPQQSDGPIPGTPVLQELLQPANDTVGVKLLKGMGWKPGQGVGPRQSRAEKRRSNRERQAAAGKVYGCSLPDFTLPQSDGEESGGSSDEDVAVTFAPDDYEPFLCRPKDNCFGIGYVGLDKRPVLSAHVNLFEPVLNMTDKNKKVNISGQAFGVGAFEEEDSDIYARDDMSQYDFSLEGGSSSKSRPPRQRKKPRWSEPDLRPTCLEGFEHPPQSAVVRKKFFPPPTLPRDFKPVHVVRRSRFEPVPLQEDSGTQQARRKGLERHSLTADDRSHIIGEKVTVPSTAVEASPSLEALRCVTVVPTATTFDSFGNRFRPFVSQPEKQQRYEHYLSLGKHEQAAGLLRVQPLSMLEWEREHERMEFEQAGRLYRPMTGVMNERFVSAAQPDDATDPLAVVERSRLDASEDLVNAAKMKMFGRMTRERSEWRPTSLLCKRFNIPEPFVTGNSSAPSNASHKSSSKFSVFDFLDAATKNAPLRSERVQEEPERAPRIPEPRIVEPQPVVAVKKDIIEVPDVPVPETSKEVNLEFPDLPEKIDLFKAIFLSSSEDSDSEEETETVPSEQPPTAADVAPTRDIPIILPEIIQNVERNTSPPRGIFANLDLDAINRRRTSDADAVVRVESSTSVREVATIDDVTTLPPGAYGPPLPSVPYVGIPHVGVPQDRKRRRSSSSSSSSSGSWEESDRQNAEKASKSSGKEKHSRKHSKHKKKKKHKISKTKTKSEKKHKKHKSHKKKHKK